MENQTEEPAPDAPVGDVPAPSVYAGLTVVELKEKLRERELPVSGTKDVLLARLAETETVPATADEKGHDYSKLSRRELKLRRKAINALAEELRHKRDELNLKSQSHAAERNELNAQAKALGTDTLVNCASQEYFGAVPDRALKLRVVTPQFLEERNGTPKIVSFYAKKARGAMARFIVQHRLTDPEAIRAFDTGGYAWSEELSEPGRPAFVRPAA